MAGYRLFCLDDGGHIIDRRDFDADDDEAAIAFARASFSHSHCELWELGRKVALIPPLRNAS
ncbi:hypothetical protein GON01_04870 [Sphingomonas sp. MAH-20]|jgi:hypothetical protein|uniref:Uncharacterized protein n=1 Tax=Sphingomonas horti TaxID=2682842 RepID=A0A6I4IYF7_9SPHN|nr:MULTISPECIES: hypothetical protein [Sphingomonas]MBA2918305.1 hypothetical protein [Sphingomonas sp. CGMCC 1.13658]MVO77272.1 hypothetical protein [Sphingomonas horti]